MTKKMTKIKKIIKIPKTLYGIACKQQGSGNAGNKSPFSFLSPIVCENVDPWSKCGSKSGCSISSAGS